MRKILKFKKEDTSKMLFFSDLHMGHDREFLWGTRGFKSEEDHRNWVLSQCDEHVSDDSILFNLGDVCFNDPKGEMFKRIASIKCAGHYVLWGNHNSGMKYIYDETLKEFMYDYFEESDERPDIEIYPLQYDNVTFVGHDLTIRVGKKEIHLSHFPKHIWDHLGRGSWHLSGHSHGNDPSRRVSNLNGKSQDVSVENCMHYDEESKLFFTYKDIENIMNHKNVVIVDHHDENTNSSS